MLPSLRLFITLSPQPKAKKCLSVPVFQKATRSHEKKTRLHQPRFTPTPGAWRRPFSGTNEMALWLRVAGNRGKLPAGGVCDTAWLDRGCFRGCQRPKLVTRGVIPLVWRRGANLVGMLRISGLVRICFLGGYLAVPYRPTWVGVSSTVL